MVLVDRITALSKCVCSNLQSLERHGKRNFADAIMLMDLEMERLS